MAAARLEVRVSAQIAEFQKSFGEMSKVAQKFAGDFEGVATRAAAVGTFFGTIAANIAGSLARGLGTALKDAIKFSSEFANAFTGLSSVARAFGTDAGLATAAAKQLAGDGLLPVKDAATGLKNLLATGFSLPEAVKLMNAFKDSAAFGRAGALSFGDAVRTATEGVKNGNSILVDNAGITKNLSQILKEAGFSAQDLSKASSDAGVRMALFNGILKEAAAFSGDAAKLTQTYSGALSALDSNWRTLLAAMGDAITKNAAIGKAINFVGEALKGLTGRLQENKAGFHLVTEGVILLVRGVSGLLTAVDLAQTAFAGLQGTINRVFIGIANAGITLFKFQEKAASLARVLDPLQWKRHEAAIKESRDAYTFLEGAVKGLSDSTKEALERSDRYGNGIQTLRAKLRDLQTDLEASRGKTIALGEAGIAGGARLGSGIEAGATKAATALKKLNTLLDDIGGPHKLGLSSAPGASVDLERANRPFTMDFSGAVRQGMEGITNLPGDIDLSKIAIPFQESFLKSAFGGSFGANFASAIQSAIQGGGSVVGAIGSSVGTALTSGLSTFLTVGKNGLAPILNGWFGGAVSAFLPGLGALLGPISEKIVGFFGNLFGNKGRDIVKEFAESFGGFDALHAKLGAELPADAERLWIALTQGVGRNNPEQAKAAIDAITAALEAQKAKQAEAAVAGEKAAAAIVAANEAAFAPLKARISELSQEYDRLFQSIASEAPEEVMGVIEQQTRERMEAIAAERTATEHQLDQATKEAAAGFADVTAAADESARDIERIFENVTIRPIRVPFDFSGLQDGGFEVPELARGGIVRRPTLALIGESGPEAVVPLSSYRHSVSAGGGDTYVYIGNEQLDPHTVRVVKKAQATGRLPRPAGRRA